ncbi:MAG TPA: hypothetical protein VFQ14_01350 [Thermoleophilaceae bacterium]|nr:hypothetical protein [Thermoleophilaceae bacterium]
MRKSLRLALAILAAVLALASVASQASARVPFGFAGVMIDGPMNAPGYDPAEEMDTMVASGVESVRFAFHWIDGQPYRDFAQVPEAQRAEFVAVGGVPTTFTRYDPMVAAAAARGLTFLANVTTAPGWASKRPGVFGSPPKGTATYARFVGALVRRYGPRGDFWAENPTLPRRPIRRWQLWNEPNLRYSWTERDWAPGYVKLLRAGRAAVKRADPGARIVLAGLANVSWNDLERIYRVRGARRLFDEVAIHPYTKPPEGVVEILERVRAVMAGHGDRRKPVTVTEFGWPSSKGKVKGIGVSTDRRGQAARLRKALPLLARHRKRLRLTSVYYYTWVTNDRPNDSIFFFAGLRHRLPSGKIVPKPAFHVYRRTALRLEGCRVKAAVATRCARR